MYLTTIVGPPPQEDYFIGPRHRARFPPVMKMQHPEIVDVSMPAEGIFQNLMIVAIRKVVSWPGEQNYECDLVAGAGDVHEGRHRRESRRDVQNSREVVWKALCAIDPERDIRIRARPDGHARPRRAHAGLRLENGH
jgi:4-hydroxy-3-polyprenylbenzoate decarboxylase